MSTPDRIRQVKTTKEKHGPNYYKKIGHDGGILSTTKFDSESAKAAANARWEKERQKNKGNNDQGKSV